MGRLRLLLAVLICGLGLAGAAFGLAGSRAAADSVYSIGLTDGAIEVESATVAPGRQVIEATNLGSEEHEIVVLKTDRAPGDLAVGLHGVSIEHSGELVVGEDHLALRHEHGPGDVLGLLPGQSRRYQVDLAPGDYVVFCQTAGHYLERGEHAAFAVR